MYTTRAVVLFLLGAILVAAIEFATKPGPLPGTSPAGQEQEQIDD